MDAGILIFLGFLSFAVVPAGIAWLIGTWLRRFDEHSSAKSKMRGVTRGTIAVLLVIMLGLLAFTLLRPASPDEVDFEGLATASLFVLTVLYVAGGLIVGPLVARVMFDGFEDEE